MPVGAETRVVVGDHVYDPERVRSLLSGTGVAVEERREPWGGDDVVGLLVGALPAYLTPPPPRPASRLPQRGAREEVPAHG